jgi:CRISPR-associated protein Cas2
MTVLILERVPATLRGELSRWMIEPRAGVFVGKVSGMVRDRLWEKARKDSKGGAGMLLFSSPTEQGFLARSFGETSRDLVEWEGLTLVFVPKTHPTKAYSGKGGKGQTTEETAAPELN